LQGHSDWIRDITISGDGHFLASGGNDRSIILWDLQSMRMIQVMREHEHVVESVAFAVTEAQEQVIEKALSNKIVAGGGQVGNAGAERRIKFLLSGSRDRTVRMWEAHSGTMLMIFSSHDNWVRGVRFHPTGKYAVSVSEDKTLRLFDIEVSNIN
jgi:platelet-activating factor acetylhydrolase IB subunit alpha